MLADNNSNKCRPTATGASQLEKGHSWARLRLGPQGRADGRPAEGDAEAIDDGIESSR